MKTYKYDSTRLKAKLHLINSITGKTYCKLENGSCKADTETDVMPQGRDLCTMCQNILIQKRASNKKKNKKRKNKSKHKDQYKEFYQSKEWAELRYQLLKSAERCLCCGATKKESRLTVDHVIPLWKRWDLRLDQNNMQILCMLCNKGKGGKDETDFREIDMEEIEEELDRQHLDNVVSIYDSTA